MSRIEITERVTGYNIESLEDNLYKAIATIQGHNNKGIRVVDGDDSIDLFAYRDDQGEFWCVAEDSNGKYLGEEVFHTADQCAKWSIESMLIKGE